MIAGLSGIVVQKDAERVVIRTPGGVAYECLVPTRSLESLPPEGSAADLLTHLAVREDALTLYGFVTAEERQVFQRLITVSGIGPKLALALLSQLAADRIVRAIGEHDIALLSSVSGVGKKTAERVVLELKDKMKDLGSGFRVQGAGPTPGAEAAIKALQKLGYTATEADDAVRTVLAGNGRKDTAELIRDALAFLSNR